MIEAVVYLLAIIIAEVVTVAVHPVWGIVGYIIVLVAIIWYPAVTDRYFPGGLILSLALVPLVRIISLSLPLANIPQIWWYPITYAPLLAAVIVVMRLLDLRREDVGLTFGSFPVQFAIGLSGLLFGVVEYFILKPEPLIAELTWPGALLPALVLLVSTGVVEELIFRGVLQRTAVEAFGGWGIVYVSLIFAILHIGFLSLIDVVFVFAVALFFGLVVKKTGSLFGVSLSHGITNIILFLVAPFVF